MSTRTCCCCMLLGMNVGGLTPGAWPAGGRPPTGSACDIMGWFSCGRRAAKLGPPGLANAAAAACALQQHACWEHLIGGTVFPSPEGTGKGLPAAVDSILTALQQPSSGPAGCAAIAAGCTAPVIALQCVTIYWLVIRHYSCWQCCKGGKDCMCVTCNVDLRGTSCHRSLQHAAHIQSICSMVHERAQLRQC
jgi:hypothetical protein